MYKRCELPKMLLEPLEHLARFTDGPNVGQRPRFMLQAIAPPVAKLENISAKALSILEPWYGTPCM
jgi:hypothetical protein